MHPIGSRRNMQHRLYLNRVLAIHCNARASATGGGSYPNKNGIYGRRRVATKKIRVTGIYGVPPRTLGHECVEIVALVDAVLNEQIIALFQKTVEIKQYVPNIDMRILDNEQGARR